MSGTEADARATSPVIALPRSSAYAVIDRFKRPPSSYPF